MEKNETGDTINSSSNTMDTILGQGIQDGALSTDELKLIYQARNDLKNKTSKR